MQCIWIKRVQLEVEIEQFKTQIDCKKKFWIFETCKPAYSEVLYDRSCSEYESRLELHKYHEASPLKCFKLSNRIFIKTTPIRKSSILQKTVEVLNS